jgi:hypothetical protein
VSKYHFISSQTGTWTSSDLCWALGVSTSGYYQWRAGKPHLLPSWQPAAQQGFTRHAGRYGTRRLRAELRAEDHQVGRYALRRWLRASGQRAQHPPATSPHHEGRPDRRGG